MAGCGSSLVRSRCRQHPRHIRVTRHFRYIVFNIAFVIFVFDVVDLIVGIIDVTITESASHRVEDVVADPCPIRVMG